MYAIILAGGLGTRLRPLTLEKPKPLLSIKGKPTLLHIIESLKKNGVTNFIISIGYKGKMIQEYFGDGSKYGISINYSCEDKPLGTGGAVKKAAKGLTQPFYLVWGDGLLDVDFSKMREIFFLTQADMVMGLLERKNSKNYSYIELIENRIIKFIEKPKNLVNSSRWMDFGVYLMKPSCLDILPDGASSIEFDCFEKITNEKKIISFLHQGQWFPIDTIEKYEIACMKFKPTSK